MEQFFRDEFYQLKQYTLNQDDDIFEKILEERKGSVDQNRFFLRYLPKEQFAEYDFKDPNSVKLFRKECLSINSPLKEMGGYNMDQNYLKEDIRYAGLKMSDPYGKIYGSFDIRNGIITYSPIFPHFYDERDLCKFANDIYFTTMTFEDIMMRQIDKASSFYVHIGYDYSLEAILKNKKYNLEKINKDQMIEFVSNPTEGEKIYTKYIK